MGTTGETCRRDEREEMCEGGGMREKMYEGGGVREKRCVREEG